MRGPTTLWGAAPDDLWGVGDFGSISHYDGTRWRELVMQPLGAPYLRVYHDLHGSAEDDLWIIGSESGVDGVAPPLVGR